MIKKLEKIFNEFEIEEIERIITFKELELDIDSINRVIRILGEHYDYHNENSELETANSIKISIDTLNNREKMSFEAMREIVEFYLNRPRVNNIFLIKFNLLEDTLIKEFPNGRYEILVTNLGKDLLSIKEDIAIISSFDFKFGEYRKKLFKL
jgi:hypothetical protein